MSIEGWTLDIGVGEKPRGIVNIDVVKTPFCNVLADAQALPFKNDVFDGIWCSQVLEHLDYPIIAIEEIKRVLKPTCIAEIDFPQESLTNNMVYRFVELLLNLPFSLFPRHLKILHATIKGVKEKNPRWYHKHLITVELISKKMKITEVKEFGDIFLKWTISGRKAKYFKNKPKLNAGVLVKCTK